MKSDYKVKSREDRLKKAKAFEDLEPTIKELRELEEEAEEDEFGDGVCEYCDGTGERTVDEWDSDSNQWTPTGTQTCSCQIKDPENDDNE